MPMQVRVSLIVGLALLILSFSNCATNQEEVTEPIDLKNGRLNDPKVRAYLASLNGAGIPEASEYRQTGIHKIIVLSPTDSAKEWEDQMPKNWVASTIDEVELVAIVREGESTLEMPSSGDLVDESGRRAFPSPRKRFSVNIEIREAKTGQLLVQQQVFGSPPRMRTEGSGPDVPDREGTMIRSVRTERVVPVDGEKPKFNDAAELLDRFVNRQVVNGRVEFIPTFYVGTWKSKADDHEILKISFTELGLPSDGIVEFRDPKVGFQVVHFVKDLGQEVEPHRLMPTRKHLGKLTLENGVLSGQILFESHVWAKSKIKVIYFSNFHRQ